MDSMLTLLHKTWLRGWGSFDFVAASLSRSGHFAQDDSGLVR